LLQFSKRAREEMQKLFHLIVEKGAPPVEEKKDSLNSLTNFLATANPKVLGRFGEGSQLQAPKITAAYIKRMAELVNEEFTDEEIRDMIEEADRDADGFVTEEDFLKVMVSKSSFLHIDTSNSYARRKRQLFGLVKCK
jgi:centrin-1